MENKTGKYFKYAIGEIVLVVIGILIALSINNWNEGRKNSLKEKRILKQLKNEYVSNLQQLDEKIFMREDIIRASSKVLKYIDNPENVEADSLLFLLTSILPDPTFDPINNDLIVSGNLHLLKNDSLKQMLSNWTSHVYQLQEIEFEYKKLRSEIITPFNVKTGISRYLHNITWKDGFNPIHSLDNSIEVTYQIGNPKGTFDTKSILNSKELEGILSEAINWNLLASIQSQALRKKINLIIELIESEIE